MKPHYVPRPDTRNDVLVGWTLYTRSGLFGNLTFARYFWVRDWL